MSPAPLPARRAPASIFSRFLGSLAFEEPLEEQFSLWYAERMRARMRNSMWIAMGCLLLITTCSVAVPALRTDIFGSKHTVLLQLMTFGLMWPSSLALLGVAYTRLYLRWFALVTQLVAPLHAGCFVTMHVLMQPQGYSLSSWLALVAAAPYFLFGMLYGPAVRTSLLVTAIYAAGTQLAGLYGAQHYFDLSMTLFAGGFAAIIAQGAQQSIRDDYLSTRVLNDSVHRDSLTGIYNRRMFDAHMDRIWQQAIRTRTPLALLMIDLDHFKAYNDHSGHQAGDTCLARVAAVLPAAARRPLDLAARYGGEEFAVLLYDMQRDSVAEVCLQLHAALSALQIPHPGAAHDPPHVTFSIGAACIQPQLGRGPEGFIQLADEALYAAKQRGRNRTVIMDREYDTLITGVFRVPTGRDEAAA
jgi:diguanylate cyclase (GGDEF)-like protein